MLKYILSLIIFVSINANAQEAFKPPIVAVIEYAKIERNSKAWKGFEEQFEKVKDQYHADIKKRQDELQKRQQELQKEAGELSPEDFAVKEKEFRDDVVALQRETDLRKRNLDDVFNKVLRQFQINIASVTAEVAQERKVDIVLNKDVNIPTLFFWSGDIAITDEVLKRFDERHPKSSITIDDKAVE